MLVEKLIFNIIAFSLFVIIFFKMIRKNDTSYLIILGLQAIGIAINFVELIFKLQLNLILKILIYILSIVIPILILICDYKKILLKDRINYFLAKTCIFLKRGKYAKKILLNIIENNPENKEAHKLLAEIYEEEGGLRKAIDEYVKVVDLDQNAFDSYYKIAVLLREFGNKTDSIDMLKKLVNKKPDYLDATITLSELLCEEERYKEALSVVNEAQKYNPNEFEIYYNLGMIYTALNDFINAKDAYEKAAIINSLQHNTDYNIAMINLIFGELDKAQEKFNLCLDDENLSALAYYNLAKINMLKSYKDEAVKYLNIAIELDNNIYKLAIDEPIFIPVKGLINYPSMDEEDIEPKITTLSKKEIKTIKHLERTYNLVGKLNSKDLGNEYINIEKEEPIEDIDKQR